LAKIPFTLIPALNIVIQQYNQAIGELWAENGITVVPPDFYSWFEQHPEQLADPLHPNGVGYQAMANLWKISLTTP
jgi:lysophospholipase L1-like esterase